MSEIIIVKGMTTVNRNEWTCSLGVQFRGWKAALAFAKTKVGKTASIAAMHDISESYDLEGSHDDKAIRKFFKDHGWITLKGRPSSGRIEIWNRKVLIEKQAEIAASFPQHLKEAGYSPCT